MLAHGEAHYLIALLQVLAISHKMDPETAETVMRLWLEDAEALLEAGDTSEDTVLAFEMFKAELTESRATNAGRLTAMIVCRATIQEIQVTRDEIMRIAEEEMISAHDHEVACSMDGREVDTGARMRSEELVESCSSLFRTIDGNNWDLSLHRQLVVSKIIIPESSPFTVGPVQTPQFVKKPSYDYLDEDEAANGESSAMALRRNKGKQRAIEMLQIECAACLGLYSRSDVVHLSCNPEPHSYCQYCIANLYETAMHDASLFPPRCCKTPIPLGDVRPFFSREFVRQYQERAVELSTINPTYCSDPKCQHFIRPSQITANIATCSKCKSHTCSVCKAPQHAGLCPEDEGTKSLLQIAKLRRWQNCYKCAQIVELTTGCNHIE